MDWPVMARQLAALQQAGVDMSVLLPQVGQVARTVQQAVAANATRIRAAGTDRWADLLQRTMPQGLVRDAILASPTWPDMAATMGRLDERGVDVAGFLTTAHTQGIGVDQTIATLLTQQPAPTTPVVPAPAAPAPVPAARTAPAPVVATGPLAEPGPPVSADALCSYGPLTEGLAVPNDLDLADRATALGQLNVDPAANSRLVSLMNTHLGEREAGLLVGARSWPLHAARMATIARGPDGEPGLRDRLKALTDNPTWQQGPASELAGRLVGATLNALTAPPGTPVPDRPHVSATAARSRSTTTTTPAPGQTAPAEPATPARRQGRSR
ncbi:hypothetical protein ACWD6R_38005 [Streptomyces sp. NPDC005151]